jgi:arsenite-transporting ATPase
MARSGSEVLVVSTDPAHSVADVFETDLGPEPTRVREDCSLYALEVDPEHRFDSAYADAFDDLVGRVESLGIDVGEIDVDSRGVIGGEEVVVVDLLSTYLDSKWDYVVLDTAPTGHTLRLLKLPEVLDSTVGTALRVKSGVDRVADRVNGIFGDGDDEDDPDVDYDDVQERLRSVGDALTDSTTTRFRVVMEPAELSLAETERLLADLEDFGVPLDAVVVNKMLTDVDESCSLCTSRRDRQQSVLEDAERRLDGRMLRVPFLEDVTLDRVAESLVRAGAEARAE